MRALLALLAAGVAGCGDDGSTPRGPLDPDTAPVVAIDRFSDEAATLLRRSVDPRLPGPDRPIDLDAAPFTIHGLGPGGEPVTLYDLDVRPRSLIPVYRFHRAGESAPVPGQLNVFDYIPGQHGYNDLWRVIDVEVPADYVANTITSSAALFAAGYPLSPTTMIVNCPMVPAGSTARHRLGSEGAALRRGWYVDQVVTYFTFEEAPIAAGQGGAPTSSVYVSYAINPDQPGGGWPSGFRTEPGGDRTHVVADSLPADAAYTPLRSVQVYDTAAFDAVHDRATADAAPRLASDTMLVNWPLVEVAR